MRFLMINHSESKKKTVVGMQLLTGMPLPLNPINQFNFNVSACCEMCLLTALFHSGMVDSLGRLCLVVSVEETPTFPDSLPRLDV